MNRQMMVIALGLGLSSVLAANAAGEAVLREDLSACELPHGTLELPDEGSPLASRGHIFNFERGKLMPDPWDLANERAPSEEIYLERIRREKTGDLAYSPLTEGSLLAMSGRIRDLGKHFLYEFDGKKLKRPGKVWSTPEPGDMEPPTPGVIQKIEEGRCYLVETVTGKFALIRLIEERSRSAIIDWVYQPSRKRVFKIPKGELIEPTAEEIAEAKETAKRQKAWALLKVDHIRIAELDKAVNSHLGNRKAVIQHLMDALKDEKETRSFMVAAVRSLGVLRAEEAAPLLASMIDEAGVTGSTRALTLKGVFACAPALVGIGKPGAAACMDEIVKLTPEDREKPFKEKLLCLVIVRVEGEKIARILLEDRKQTAKNTQEIENLQRAIDLIDEVKSW